MVGLKLGYSIADNLVLNTDYLPPVARGKLVNERQYRGGLARPRQLAEGRGRA